ncbi:MAG: TonB family protein [Xanthomonadales bacterium]|nr:TonB family protein [Gammaproteobacteria bacterium]NNJ65181.1 TonB family protein [Xanthomonadales bacterium]NNK32810.1 TonB family protein [Xanthomonadales bacterium]NNK36838.1 TonB family protein [Xanthomonadales bacterium]
MERRERLRRLLAATATMLFGTVLVLSTVILINYYSNSLEDQRAAVSQQIQFERKKPPEQQQVEKKKPKPKPRRTPRNPPPPLTGLDTTLSGVDMGLPGFSADDLSALEGDLLGGAGGMVMTDDTVDQPPRASFQAPMIFPPRARAKGVEGYVVFSLLIGVTGEIEQLKIIESYPEGVFDESATQGINQWRFEPAMYQGQAVRAWAKQRIRFDLS